MASLRDRWPRLPPFAMDAVLAVGVGLLAAAGDGLGADHRSGSAPIWDLALAAPLVFRRKTSAVSAAALGLLCFAQWLVGSLATGDVAVLLMLYTLGVHEARRWVLASAVGVAEVGVVLAVIRWSPTSNQWQTGLMLTGTITAAWVLGVYVRTHRAYLDATIKRAESAERERDTQAAAVVAAERTRMAREIHDIVAHSLSVMVTLNDAAAAVSDPRAAQRAIAQASEVGRQAMAEMSTLLQVLRADTPAELVPLPGSGQLTELVAMVRAAGLRTELSVTGSLDGLPASIELAVYRIVQESLTNILKHARNVTRVDVLIVRRHGRITINVHDDGDACAPGSGMPRSGIPRAGMPGSGMPGSGMPGSGMPDSGLPRVGHGLTGMRERVAVLGGHLDAAPAPSGGWLVKADLASLAPVGAV